MALPTHLTTDQLEALVELARRGSLRAAADVTAARSRVDLAKALFDQAADLQKNGAGIKIDTLRSNVQYQNETQRLINAQTQLKTSISGFRKIGNPMRFCSPNGGT